jgi:hypothetical protein
LRQVVRPAIGLLAVLLVVEYVLLPQLAGARKIVRAGVPRSQAVSGKTLQTVGLAVVLNIILGAALITALILHGGSPLYTPIAAAGLSLLLLVSAPSAANRRSGDPTAGQAAARRPGCGAAAHRVPRVDLARPWF